MKRDLTKLKSRKKFWDFMGFGYKFENSLFKTHSLNCGCGICKINTFYKKYRHRQERVKLRSKQLIEKEMIDETS